MAHRVHVHVHIGDHHTGTSKGTKKRSGRGTRASGSPAASTHSKADRGPTQGGAGGRVRRRSNSTGAKRGRRGRRRGY